MNVSTATLNTCGPSLVLRAGPIVSGFMHVSTTLDFSESLWKQPTIERIVHLRSLDILLLADAFERHVASIQTAGEVDDGHEFINLDLQLNVCLLSGEIRNEGEAIFAVRCLLNLGSISKGGLWCWLGVEAEVNAFAAERFVSELRSFAQSFQQASS